MLSKKVDDGWKRSRDFRKHYRVFHVIDPGEKGFFA